MSYPIPADAQRLADRLRMLADEVESAARFGIPIPFMFSISGSEYGQAGFAATPAEFDAWTEYIEGGVVEEYQHAGKKWRAVNRADVNGLPLSFSAEFGEVSA